MIKVETDQTLLIKDIPLSSGIAYDGYWIYFTVKGEKKIIKYDTQSQQAQWFETSRCYSYLCFDSKDNCLWAMDAYDSSCVYRLNESFESVDTLCILVPGVKEIQNTGIAYDDDSNQLILMYSNVIVRVDKDSFKEQIVGYYWNRKSMKRVVGISESYLYSFLSPQNEIHIHSKEGKFLGKVCISNQLTVVSVDIVANKDVNHSNVYILASREDGTQCLICCSIHIEQQCEICEHKSDFKSTCINDGRSNSNCGGRRDCRRNCNSSLRRDCRSNCNCSCRRNGDWCSKQLECIALEEARLAHILNVAGEKFARVKRNSKDIREVRAAHRSIRRVVNHVADKEFILTCKLLKLKECCDFCKD